MLDCGIDIEELDRFKKIFSENDGDIPMLIKDVFSEKEITINMKNETLLRFALGFSCKEAVFKSLGSSWTNSGIFWKEIELIFKGTSLEKHSVKLSGIALKLFKKNKYKEIKSSFSYNELYVAFKIILLG
jgi:phosphopantetheine--protein transferase-like protein